MNSPKFNGGNQNQSANQQGSKTILKTVSCGLNINEAIIKLDEKIRNMEKEGYRYHSHIDLSPGEKILVFVL